MIVLDASVVVEWLLRLPRSDHIAGRLSSMAGAMHAPHVLAVEVVQVIRRYVRSGEISQSRGAEAVTDLADLGLIRYAHEPLLPLIWQLRDNFTAYDAAYVALALALDAPLLTLDRRLAVAPHGAEVELVLA